MMNTKLVGAVLLGLALIAALMWYITPTPMPPAIATAPDDNWKLPDLVKDQTTKYVDLVVARNFWGEVVPTQAGSTGKPEWRFAGVMTNGAERSLLISIDNKPAEVLQVGGQLPGGSKILKISEDRLCILINGKKRMLPIYRQ